MDIKARLVLKAPAWPSIFDLRCGGSLNVERKGRRWNVKLLSVRVERSHDWRPGAFPGNKMIREAKAMLEVDGHQCLLRLAPFEFPTVFQGLRIHLEMVKALNAVDASAKESFHFDARLSAAEESEPWTPLAFRFPLPGHLWRANPCYGAWSALAAGDTSRYCDGFNLGVSDDAQSAVAVLAGSVKAIKTQRENPDLATITLEHLHSVKSIYGNIEARSLPFNLSEGAPVEPGDLLGKVSLLNEPPHLHFGLQVEGFRINPYPALVEAYLRESQENALPSAGGMLFCHPGETLQLDSSSTVLRPGRSIEKCAWLLSDGTAHNGSQASLSYSSPGFRCEELHIVLDNGEEYRETVQTRVFKPGVKGQSGFPGWLAHSPAKGIKPEGKVSFRLIAPKGCKFDALDFGDGVRAEAPAAETSHSYSRPGLYTVEALGSGPDGVALSLKRFVRVQAPPC